MHSNTPQKQLKGEAYKAAANAFGIITTQIANLVETDLDVLIKRLGALPYTVRSAGGEGFGSEVENEQEVELEIEAEQIAYQPMPSDLTAAKTAPWQLPQGKSVYNTPNLLKPVSEELVDAPPRVTLHTVAEHGQQGFFSDRLLATNNFLKTTSRPGADLFSDMTACQTQKPASFMLVSYEGNSQTPELILLSLEDQRFFMEQLTPNPSDPAAAPTITTNMQPWKFQKNKGDLRRLCMCDLSGNIIRAGNSGLTQQALDNDEHFQQLRVQAKLLHAPVEPNQPWHPADHRRVKDWLMGSSHEKRVVKKRYLELVAPGLSVMTKT